MALKGGPSLGGCAQSGDGGCSVSETGEDGFAPAGALVVQAWEAPLGDQVVQPLMAASPFVEASFASYGSIRLLVRSWG